MENFIVSARKYRPATFMSVIGQGHITSTLVNAISRSQLAHAYLFCGPRGVGKTTCARIFAKAINCLSPVDSEACGECESCKGFNEGRSFNIHELDAASNNSVDDIRSLTDQVRIPPQIGRYSVYIIDEVHMLSSQAFNAFLKTLEEPPAHAIFILATTEKHKIIPTILSRCQIFDFNRIRVEDGVSYLKYIAEKENITYDDESLHLIAQKADGGMRDALSMFDKAVSFCGSNLNFKEVAQSLNVLDYDTYFTLTTHILAGYYQSALLIFDEVLRKGFSGQVFMAGMNAHFRDILMCKNPQTLPLLEVTGSLLERYKKQGADCDVGFLFEAISLLTSLDGTLRTSSNQRLSVELGLMKLCGLGQKKNNPEGLDDDSESTIFNIIDIFPLPPLKRGDDTVMATPVQKTAQPHEQQSPQKVVSAEDAKTTASQDNMSEESIGATAPHNLTEEKTKQIQEQTPFAATQKHASTQSQSRKTVSISGASISSILNRTKQDTDTVDAAIKEESIIIDPECESKIASKLTHFMEQLSSSRPRMAMAFHGMNVVGHIISISVPNESLHDEIMRNRTEVLTLLAEVAGIEGTLDLKITISTDNRALKPIKVEDKLKYLVEKNPLLNLLRKEMDMDVE